MRTQVRLTVVSAALVASAAVALGDALEAANIRALPRLHVLTSPRRADFFVLNPFALESLAWRDTADLADKNGVEPLPPGPYVLTARVIARAPDETTIRSAAAIFHTAPRLIDAPLPGFWRVHYASVMEAAEAAERMSLVRGIEEVYLDMTDRRSVRVPPNDPDFVWQWHLNNTTLPSADLNVEPAWAAGYGGNGVVIGIIEDGWQLDHPDLALQFVTEASQPGGAASAHATSVAGCAAACGNNSLGGLGVAYQAGLSSQLFGSVSENAAAFAYRNDLNDIKVAAWGPPDDGYARTLSSIEQAALQQAVESGRNGRGEVFAWSAGNGGLLDRVDYDPYASSRWVCSIGAIGDQDLRATYNETGSAMMVVAPSSGNNRRVYTTTSFSGYTASFGGTSASAPQAAGVIALMLEASPSLSWRDVQNVLIRSARQVNPSNADWTLNGTDLHISYNFGFGAIDTEAAINLARSVAPLPPEVLFDTGTIAVNAAIPDNSPTGVTRTITVSRHMQVESVELVLNASTSYIGDLRVTLTSARGTPSLLADVRDDPQDDYVEQVFTTRRCWGEPGLGTWIVNIADLRPGDQATLNSIRLRVYGADYATPLGDMNCDGLIDNSDVDGFILALLDPLAYETLYPGCTRLNADVNSDQRVDSSDIDPFVALIAGI